MSESVDGLEKTEQVQGQEQGQKQVQPSTRKQFKSSTRLVLLVILGIVLFGSIVSSMVYLIMQDQSFYRQQANQPIAIDNAPNQPNAPPIYYYFKPPFIANFADDASNRYLQVEIQVMTRSKQVIQAIKYHEPLIKNNILLLLSHQNADELKTREGREALNQKVLIELQRILTEQTGKPGVEAVYFSSFLLQ